MINKFRDQSPPWAKTSMIETNTVRYLKSRDLVKNLILLFPRWVIFTGKAFWKTFKNLAIAVFLDILSGLLWMSRITISFRRKKDSRPLVVVFAEGTFQSGLSPAANYRVYKVKREFEARNWNWKIVPAIPSKYHVVHIGHWKFLRVARVIEKFMDGLLKVHRYWQIVWNCPIADVVVFQRELTCSFSLSLEFLARSLSKKLVFDFDDALFTEQPWDDMNNELAVEFRRLHKIKVDRILSEVDGITASNEYLASYARNYNDRVSIAPTPVDTQLFCPSPRRFLKSNQNGVISWIGTSGNLAYVNPLIDTILKAIRDTEPSWKFVIVCNSISKNDLRFYEDKGIDFQVWRPENEVKCFQDADIGLMPLKDEPWSRGKMGYKLLQYMSCGLPVVASPVGYNTQIIHPEGPQANGFLARSQEDWYDHLVTLISHPEKRTQMGDAGRQFVEAQYGLHSFVNPLEKMIQQMLETSNAV